MEFLPVPTFTLGSTAHSWLDSVCVTLTAPKFLNPQVDVHNMSQYTGRLADMIEQLATNVEDAQLESLPKTLDRIYAQLAMLQSSKPRGTVIGLCYGQKSTLPCFQL